MWRVGRHNEALRHLETAQEASQDAESTAPVAWVISGFALFSIGRVDEGIRAVTDYLKARDGNPAHARTRCRSLARLAVANLHDGNLKAGVAVAATCLSLAQRLSSWTVQDHLTQLEKAAASRRDSTCRDLAERIRLVQTM